MPALLGVASSQGLRFELDDTATVGRSPECRIVLADVLVSGRHAEIRREPDGRYRIADLGATHGTFVNGARVAEAVLADGDEIIVGATRMRFEDRGPRAVAAGDVSVDDQAQFVRLRVPVSVAAFPPARALDLTEANRAYERLRVAYEVARALADCRDVDAVLRVVLERVFELLPADRGAILLVDPAGTLVPRVASRRDGKTDPLIVPRSILHEIVTHRVGLVSVDATADARFGRAPSLIRSAVRSALSVPLVRGDELVGAIYVDAVLAGLFDDLDLEVMATIGGQAALAVVAARLRAGIDERERMAAVGQVAAGLAHDFANVMTTIGHGAEMVRRAAGAAPELAGHARMIATAADHAIVLTRKLASLARGGGSAPRVVDLSAAVDELADLVRRVLGQHVEVVVERTDAPCPVLIDRDELEQIVLNLAYNAREAMAGHGTLTLGCTADAAAHRVVLSVTDTGTGMAPEVRAHLFEPFFTTRTDGRGSGLGLSIVRRLVIGSRGGVEVDSGTGRGTVFRIAWPLATAEVVPRGDRATAPATDARLLVVDDDEGVRAVMVAILERAGYTVTSAARGEDALLALADRSYAALIVDVVLAGMSGRQIAERALAIRPELCVLYVSGFTSAAEADELTGLRAEFLAKPLAARDLEARVAAMLRGDPVPRPRRPGLMMRYPTGAAFLAGYDEATASFPIATAHQLPIDDRPVTTVVRFEDAGREFRVRGRVVARTADGVRIELTPDQEALRDLILASARGESVPYFRRAEPRFAACIGAKLTTGTGLELMSHTQDLSARGLMLSTDHRLELGTTVTLELAFPDRPAPIRVAGRIASTIRTGPRRGVGIEFQFESAAQRGEIAARVAALETPVQ